jgi:hypothetical protein
MTARDSLKANWLELCILARVEFVKKGQQKIVTL